jgi:hypothetical protein
VGSGVSKDADVGWHQLIVGAAIHLCCIYAVITTTAMINTDVIIIGAGQVEMAAAVHCLMESGWLVEASYSTSHVGGWKNAQLGLQNSHIRHCY